jgi:hypothetical protein
MPTELRAIEDNGACFIVTAPGKKNPPPRSAAGGGLGRLPNIFNITPDRFWLDAYFVSGMTKRCISVQPTSRAKKLLGLLQTFG